MKNTTLQYLLPCLFSLLLNIVKAQDATAGFDTIFQAADRVSVNKFHFEHPDFTDIGFRRFTLNLEKPSARNGNIRRFFINGVIENSIDIFNWDVCLYGDWKKVLKLSIDPELFKKAFRSNRNFAISGKLENIPFKLIYIQPIRMAWMFKEDQLQAVFATDDINNPDAIKAGGQVSDKSFLLLKHGHRWDDEAEMIRLSMMTMLIADLVKPGKIY
jgi:hypothetical protein